MPLATDGLERKAELGQVFTPPPVARMMAATLQTRAAEVRLLDAGAGAGALTVAAAEEFCRRSPEARPRTLHVTAYEIDACLMEPLHRAVDICRVQCLEAGIGFQVDVINRDFIESAAEQLAGGLFYRGTDTRFNCAVLNPPYRKIHSASRHRLLLSRMGVETSNLYTGFLAAAIRLLEMGGEIVAVTPRSFCNGPYFKPFRQEMLRALALDRLHLFESRGETFREDNILQETLIFHAVKGAALPDKVHVSSVVEPDGIPVSGYDVPYSEVVSLDDPNVFIHIPLESKTQCTARQVCDLPCTLSDLGLNISTGRVVDFRARVYLRPQPELGTVPLIYPAHLEHSRVTWPRARRKKPNSILAVKETETLLVPNAHYVLIRRFSTKEEKKRLVATVFEAGSVPGKCVGFENHLNYFHCRGAGLNIEVARGLAAFLNSTPADHYFRQFNGHTQVNATDLRSFCYPTLTQLREIGAKVGDAILEQNMLDALLEGELDAPSR